MRALGMLGLAAAAPLLAAVGAVTFFSGLHYFDQATGWGALGAFTSIVGGPVEVILGGAAYLRAFWLLAGEMGERSK